MSFYDHQLIIYFSCLSYKIYFQLFILFRLDWFGFNSIRVISGSGLHQAIRVRVSLDSIRVISNFGSLQFWVGLILSRFNFEFRVEIDSTLSHVGSGLVLGCSVRVIFTRSRLFGSGCLYVSGYEVFIHENLSLEVFLFHLKKKGD